MGNVSNNGIAFLSSLALLFALAVPSAAQEAGEESHGVTPPDIARASAEWPEASKNALEHMIGTYGPPAAITPELAVWGQTGDWKRTVVFGHEVLHDFPMPHTDVMQQWIDYDVPVDMYDELAWYDGSVVLERTSGEMSARCDKEAANFLALNLAHEIVEGIRTVEEARLTYLNEMKHLMNEGPTEYTGGFTFVNMVNTGDPDRVLNKNDQDPSSS